jgi:PAB1-binding protein PBP1
VRSFALSRSSFLQLNEDKSNRQQVVVIAANPQCPDGRQSRRDTWRSTNHLQSYTPGRACRLDSPGRFSPRDSKIPRSRRHSAEKSIKEMSKDGKEEEIYQRIRDENEVLGTIDVGVLGESRLLNVDSLWQ